MTTQITVFDGARCIGGSKIHLLVDDVGFFLDFGMNFGSYGRYFEEFVQPRTARGIHDLWVLNLIPHLGGIYRKDIFPGDFSMKPARNVQVNGIFISHAHLDHTGNIGLLDSHIPVYASSMTAAIVKAMQDCGRSTFESEIAYTAPRAVAKADPRAIAAARGANCQSRPMRIVDEGIDFSRFSSFWAQTFSTKTISSVSLTSANRKIEGVNFRSFPVDHSIFGATAYAFETSAGWIAYSGDMRLHGTRGYLTAKFVEELAKLKPLAFIVEGTNISEEKGTTEDEVYVNCLQAARAASGKLIIADFGPRNIERLEIFLRIAREVKRTLLINAKDAFLLYAMHLADPTVPDALSDPNLGIFDEVKATMNIWERDFIRANFASKYVSAADIKRNQGNFIMAFSFFDLKHLLDIMPDDGVYIYSSSEAFSEEQEIDIKRLKNWLDFFKIEPVGFTVESDEINFIKGYHASGHISGGELIEAIKTIKPRILIPVHTEQPELFKEKLHGEPIEVRFPQEGVAMPL